jgi:branched-chain amino acid transport system ATP-binding protein
MVAIMLPSAHFSPDASADIPDPPGLVPTGRVPRFWGPVFLPRLKANSPPLYGRAEHADNAGRGGTVVPGDTVLETEDLTKDFAGFVAVRGVNLRVARGSIHAMIGPNGAGKTTCFNLLTKFLRPSRGRIVFDGRDITALKPADVAQLGLVRSFQISAVFPHLTVLENVRIALQRKRGGSFDFWRSKSVLHGLDTRALALIADVGLTPYANLLAVELPYGRKRALEIATTLALDPAMLLLDEPMAGMGHEDIKRISELIKSVAATRTVLMVEHNLSVVADLCDRITVLTRGQVLAEGDYKTVSENPAVREAYLGTGHA